MTSNRIRTPRRASAALAVATLIAITAACGGSSSSAKSSATDPSGSATAPTADSGGRGGNRTRSPEIQTAIAQGTQVRGNRTPSAAMATAIAQGTQVFGNRTPSSADATAIAQGTPAGALRRFGGGGARVLASVATLLAIDEAQLRTELQAPGASIEKVAAAHGVDRAKLRQRLIDAVRQRSQDAVASGSISQAMADQNASDFEANIDRTIDAVGGGQLDAPPPTP